MLLNAVLTTRSCDEGQGHCTEITNVQEWWEGYQVMCMVLYCNLIKVWGGDNRCTITLCCCTDTELSDGE